MDRFFGELVSCFGTEKGVEGPRRMRAMVIAGGEDSSPRPPGCGALPLLEDLRIVLQGTFSKTLIRRKIVGAFTYLRFGALSYNKLRHFRFPGLINSPESTFEIH